MKHEDDDDAQVYADTLLIAYQQGFADGKKAALAQEQALKKLARLGQEIEQQAEPVSHAAIAGALFDFMGWLTTRKERLVLSSTDNASPAVESITEFAKMRGLSLDDAKVQDWNTSLPQQQAEPVAWMDREGDLYKMPEIKNWAPPHTMLYTTPPQRKWDKPSASFNAWWDSYRHDPANPFAEGSAAYWAWAGWQAAQRPWQGLTDEERMDVLLALNWDKQLTHMDTAKSIEAKLKERNNG